MRISIFGLGYVGAVTSSCFAKDGHTVVGVDPDQRKLDLIRAGQSPIVEEGLEDLIKESIASGRLTVTNNVAQAIADTDVSLICVGTPSMPNGRLKTEFVERVSYEIGRAIKAKGKYHSVVVRSTVLPGTTESVVVPVLERETGGKVGETFGVSMNPEFLREGVSIYDYYHPPYTVIGTASKEEFERIKGIYSQVPGEVIHCQLPTAEAIKYGCNVLHAVKITFANEMGLICKTLGVDATEVMEILCKDTKLNISAKYMKPGFAFGGSCLPKDLRAITQKAVSEDVLLPMFSATLVSNRSQIEKVAERIMSKKTKKVALMGVSFKEGTDDLRESPLVTLAELLFGKGFDLKIFDPDVKYASLYGSNKSFIDSELPHFKKILVSAEEALAHADVLVFGHNSPKYRELLPKVEDRHTVFDLVRVTTAGAVKGTYEGLYW
jgi:GDP-mannose 6-dehydrogenase